MTTALEIITGAARLLGVVRKGEALDGDEAETGLIALNAMTQSWQNESLLTHGPVRETITLTTANTYLLGSGLLEETITDPFTARTVDMTPPLKIISAFIRSDSVDYPVSIITDTEYDNIAVKSSSGTSWFMSYTLAEGLVTYTDIPSPIDGIYSASIRLYPSPNSGDVLHLLCEKLTSVYATLSTAQELKPGWERAIKYNLAIDLAPEYGVEPSPAVVKIAKESLAAIRLGVARNRKIAFNRNIRKDNIFTGGPL